MNRQFLHITKVENTQVILEEGLRINGDSQIFVFTQKKNASRIAYTQLFLTDKFTLIGINGDGIVDWGIKHDDVGELTAYDQFILTPPKKDVQFIKPEFLRFLGIYEIIKINYEAIPFYDKNNTVTYVKTISSPETRLIKNYKI
jgi:hypothetical protein